MNESVTLEAHDSPTITNDFETRVSKFESESGEYEAQVIRSHTKAWRQELRNCVDSKFLTMESAVHFALRIRNILKSVR